MSSDYDATEFVDGDLEPVKSQYSATPAATSLPRRAPTREEVDSRVADAQQKLVELRRAQEELERERATLEETRRRQMEFQTGRQEMMQNLTRGLGLLEEAEFAARRDAEQLAKTLADFRDAVTKISAIHEETWTKDNFSVELTRALTTLENARMEWNGARLKLPVLAGSNGPASPAAVESHSSIPSSLAGCSFGDLCRFGFALTWPVAAAALLGSAVVIAVLLRR